MATITITAAATAFSPPSKVFTMTDQVMQDMTDAYQVDANASINATATRAQVLNYITTIWQREIKEKIQQFKTVPAVIPTQPVIT